MNIKFKSFFSLAALLTVLSLNAFNAGAVSNAEWQNWYNSLSDEEKLAVNYEPSTVGKKSKPIYDNYSSSITDSRITSDILQRAKKDGQNINFKTENGAMWSIASDNIFDDTFDINVNVEYNTKNIPSKLIKKAVEKYKAASKAQITVGSESKLLCFSGNVTVKFNIKNANKGVRFYRYDIEENKLLFIGKDTIDKDGYASFNTDMTGDFLALIILVEISTK